jgi:uncharacterized membrane protein YgdD (TMEM256/DUF423 family)
MVRKVIFLQRLNNFKMDRKLISAGGLLGMLAIILGAFGAHALKNILPAEQLVTFETGVRYQMYHALFLIFIGMISSLSEKTKKTICFLVLSGVCLFSGSIYLLATNNITSFDFRVIGFVTPIGGLLLILAWSMLFFNFAKKTSTKLR